MGEAPLHVCLGGGAACGRRRRSHRSCRRCLAAQVRELGSGAFGTAQLMRDKQSGELVAIKYIPRRDVSAPRCRAVPLTGLACVAPTAAAHG